MCGSLLSIMGQPRKKQINLMLTVCNVLISSSVRRKRKLEQLSDTISRKLQRYMDEISSFLLVFQLSTIKKEMNGS